MINLHYDDENVKIDVEFPNSVTADEFLDQVRTFMMAVGYAEATIRESFTYIAEELQEQP